MWFASSVDVHEGACSHGDLYITHIEATFSEHGRLLVRHLQQSDSLLQTHWILSRFSLNAATLSL